MYFANWLVFALITPFLWAINNIADRILISRLVKNEYALTLVAAMTRLMAFFAVWGFSGWFVPEIPLLAIAIFAGALGIIPVIFYFKALGKEDTLRVILLYDASNPLFVLILSVLFLGERFNFFDGTGFVLLLLAGIFSVLKLEKNQLRFRRHGLWIIVAALFWAPSDVLFAYLVPKFPSIPSLLAWLFLGGFIGGFPLLASKTFRSRCRKNDFKWQPRAWIFFLGSTIIAFLGSFTFLKAVSLERVSLTVVLANVQPFFVFIFELILAYLFLVFPKVDLSFRNIFPKIVAFIFVLTGIWFLQY